MTTVSDIRGWLERGQRMGATHLIVVTDTYDWDDYPVYVKSDRDARKIAEKYEGMSMQRVTEVYRLDLDWEQQLNNGRVMNF